MISAILSHPDSFDFPIFRNNLAELQKHVDEVIVCFTQHGNNPLRDWLTQNMPGVTFLSDEQGKQYPGDWRNKSTNLMVDTAKGDWILSLEPDFFIRDYDFFFSKVKNAMKSNEVISFAENQRFHPAFLLCKREVLDKTTRDFSVQGTDKDHFWLFTKQLKGIAKSYTDLNLIGLRNTDEWFHMGGLTENYFAPQPYYRLADFHSYNDACMNLNISMSEYWRGEMQRCSKAEHPVVESLHIKKFI